MRDYDAEDYAEYDPTTPIQPGVNESFLRMRANLHATRQHQSTPKRASALSPANGTERPTRRVGRVTYPGRQDAFPRDEEPWEEDENYGSNQPYTDMKQGDSLVEDNTDLAADIANAYDQASRCSSLAYLSRGALHAARVFWHGGEHKLPEYRHPGQPKDGFVNRRTFIKTGFAVAGGYFTLRALWPVVGNAFANTDPTLSMPSYNSGKSTSQNGGQGPKNQNHSKTPQEVFRERLNHPEDWYYNQHDWGILYGSDGSEINEPSVGCYETDLAMMAELHFPSHHPKWTPATVARVTTFNSDGGIVTQPQDGLIRYAVDYSQKGKYQTIVDHVDGFTPVIAQMTTGTPGGSDYWEHWVIFFRNSNGELYIQDPAHAANLPFTLRYSYDWIAAMFKVEPTN